MGKMVVGRWMMTLKTKFRSLKGRGRSRRTTDTSSSSSSSCSSSSSGCHSSYDKIEKSESMRVEIRSRKARKLIEETLKVADSPNSTKSYAF